MALRRTSRALIVGVTGGELDGVVLAGVDVL